MKKPVFLFISIALGMLIAACVFAGSAAGQSEFNAYQGQTIADDQIDGTIGSEWNDAGAYKNVTIDPYGIASLWLKQDGTYLYLGMRFYADSTDPWVALQFGSTFCMSTSSDGAIFGSNKLSDDGYQDISFNEAPGITADAHQDGRGVMTVNASRYVSLELKKPLDSGDAAGKDLNWSAGNPYTFLIMWDSDGQGSSGGTGNHAGGGATENTVHITTSSVPELPTMMAFSGLLAATAVAVAFKLKAQKKPETAR